MLTQRQRNKEQAFYFVCLFYDDATCFRRHHHRMSLVRAKHPSGNSFPLIKNIRRNPKLSLIFHINMKQTVALFLLSVITGVSCEDQSVTTGLNQFSVSLFKLISDSEGAKNVFTSPFSAATALSMLELGARGESAEQILRALNLNGTNDAAVHQSSQQLIQEAQTDAGVQIANYLLIKEQSGDNEVLNQFTSDLQSFYSAQIDDVNFATNGDAIQQQVNEWAEKETHGLIKDLLQQPPDPLTAAMIVNAVYFKGQWVWPFPEILTKKGQFYNNGVTSVEVDLMHQEAPFAVTDSLISGQEVQLVELPYMDSKVNSNPNYPSAMIIVLPKEKTGLSAILSGESFQNDLLASLDGLKDVKRQYIDVSLPKFNIESSYHMKTTLKQMGVTDVFGLEADLSGITGEQGLYVESVEQKSLIRVDEKGTETATVTYIPVENRSVRFPAFEVNVDHPFLFLIYDRLNTLILFMGKVEVL